MQDIAVCVKQVPNTTNIKLDPENHTLIREGVESILNPFDELALDWALKCKKLYGVKVGVITMGPPQAEEILSSCIEKGADQGILITDKRLAGSDTLITAKVLFSCLKKTNYKNIFCGQESIDSSTGHIGASLAELFDSPQINYISEILQVNKSTARVKLEWEDKVHILDVELPAVFSFKKSHRRVSDTGQIGKYPEKKVRTYNLDDLELDENEVGLKGSPTRVVDIDLDENAIDILRVDEHLPSFKRIEYILSGGVEINPERIILQGSSISNIELLLDILQKYQ